MKWRNQLLALFCLLVFAGLGVLYFQHWVIRKPFGIVLFIGEGLAPGRLAPTRAYVGGAATRLSLDSMPHVALVTNCSKDFAAPDQAAAATAIATGVKVNNRAVALNADGKSITSIVEFAREYGRATGLVTDAKLTDPTCAAFYAHPVDPNDVEKIAAEFVDGGKIDIAMGGGMAQFLPTTKGGERQDGRDLYSNSVATGSISFELVPSWKRFPHGAGRNFSALLTMWNSRLPTKLKSEASNRVFRIWCGERSNYFNTTLADTCWWSMQD